LLQSTFWVIPIGFIAGALGDLTLWALRPGASRPLAFRAFAVLLPIYLYSSYFGFIAAEHGIVWIIHLWTGAIFMAGAMGFFASYLILAPPFADKTI
jgi:hypothetical protein